MIELDRSERPNSYEFLAEWRIPQAFLGGLEPSVAQPPLPLQLFLPSHPWSLALQPPWPLQSFLPLQECLAVSCAA